MKALVQFGWETKKADFEKNSGGGYIDRLEASLRDSIQNHRETLLSLTVREAASQKLFVSRVSERMLEVDGLTSSSQSFIKIVSIDLPRHHVHAIIRQCTTLDSSALGGKLDQVSCVDGEYQSIEFVGQTHVTMVHYKQLSQAKMRANFESILEKEVFVDVTGLLWNERIAALAVDVAAKIEDGNEIPRPQNSFPHITVWHRDDVSPAESNDLPGLLATGHAHKISLPNKARLIGNLTFWRMDQH